jgi:MFS family permease
MPMMLGSVVGSQIGGLLTTRLSYRNIMIISGICFLIGVFLLGTISPDTPRIKLTLYMIVTGFGVGFSFSVLSMAAIHHFDMRQRGAATSANSFLRSLGMTLGITIFGIIQRNLFSNRLAESFSGMPGGAPSGMAGDPRDLLSPEKRVHIPSEVLQKITDILASSIAHTFRWALIPAGLAVLFIFAMSGERVRRTPKQVKPAADH